MKTTAPRPELAQILADLRGEARVLDRNGQHSLATRYDAIASEVTAASKEWLTWLDETEAALRSGWKLETVRRWARRFLNTEHVQYDGQKKCYIMRACIVPVRQHQSVIEAAARSQVA